MSPRERGRRFDWRYRGFWDLIRSSVLKAAASAETTPERAQRLVELLAGEAA